MNLFFPSTHTLENIGREIVVFQIVKAVLDHLPQVEGFGTTGLGGEEIEALLGFGGESYGSCHCDNQNTCIQYITTGMILRRL